MILSELYNLKYLLLIEISLLTLFAFYGYIPILAVFSIILLGILLFLVFNSPILAVHILIFSILIDSLIPFKASSVGPSILVVEFFLIILLGLVIIKFLLSYDHDTKIPNYILVWIPFLVWSLVIGLLIGVDKLRVASYWKNYFAGFFVFSLSYYAIKNKIHLKSIILGVIIWGLLLSLLEIKILIELGGFTAGIVGLFLKKNLLTVGWGRSNYLAAFFVVIIPFTIGYLLFTKSKKIKIFLIASIVVMSFAIILTLSRGGIIALLIALVILFSRVMKYRTFIPLLSLLLIIATVLLLNPLTYVLFDRISSVETTSSFFSRINFFEDVWHAFLRNPMTGVGLGNLSYYATFILAPDASPSAHNIFLGALGEIGAVGAFLFFALLGTFLFKIFSDFKNENDESLKIFRWCCFASFIGGLIHTLVEPTLEGLQFSIMYWTLASVFIKLDLFKN